ncbi:hypothetical protein Gotur_014336 [Gossypium turneri]
MAKHWAMKSGMSSSNLNGKVPPAIASLSQLQHLDLSDNSLTAPVPKFLANLQLLSVLNLSRNMFNGSIPAELMERANQVSSSDQKTDVVDSRKTNQLQGSLKNRQFTHAQLKRMTNNFGRVVGKGGFGTVYHGYLDETQVAVKMLSLSPVQGYKQFQAEVELLLRVHHRNLTTIVGYCDYGSNMGLIYEFMAKGNLAEYLKDSSRGVLNWKGRLGISLEAAHKLSDFGLSKAFPLEGDTHVITVVAGTPWYVDSEDLSNNSLTGAVPEFLSQLKSSTVLGLTLRCPKMDDDQRQNSSPSLGSKNRRFTFAEVQRMSNYLERILGKGGFGTVFRGYLDDSQAAVKMLSHSSVQGYKQRYI